MGIVNGQDEFVAGVVQRHPKTMEEKVDILAFNEINGIVDRAG